VLSQNCVRSLSALCALFVAERAQSLSSVFPRFSLAAAFAVGCSLLPSSSAQSSVGRVRLSTGLWDPLPL
jgi:hypothetical protein